jgi:hypothetical protein
MDRASKHSSGRDSARRHDVPEIRFFTDLSTVWLANIPIAVQITSPTLKEVSASRRR